MNMGNANVAIYIHVLLLCTGCSYRCYPLELCVKKFPHPATFDKTNVWPRTSARYDVKFRRKRKQGRIWVVGRHSPISLMQIRRKTGNACINGDSHSFLHRSETQRPLINCEQATTPEPIRSGYEEIRNHSSYTRYSARILSVEHSAGRIR